MITDIVVTQKLCCKEIRPVFFVFAVIFTGFPIRVGRRKTTSFEASLTGSAASSVVGGGGSSPKSNCRAAPIYGPYSRARARARCTVSLYFTYIVEGKKKTQTHTHTHTHERVTVHVVYLHASTHAHGRNKEPPPSTPTGHRARQSRARVSKQKRSSFRLCRSPVVLLAGRLRPLGPLRAHIYTCAS